jgi:membrane-anchored protein YejM (alkaline phosphatase superfamily)
MRFLNNSLTAKLAGNGFFEQYRYLIMAITLNLPVIFFILLMDMKQVNLSYYILPLILIATILTVLLFALKRVLALFVGAAVVFYVYYLLIDHFVYTIAKIHIDLFWLEWIINDFHSFGLPSSTLRYVLLAFVGVEFVIFKFAKKIRKPRFLSLITISLVFTAFSVSQVIHIFAYHKNYQQITNLSPHFPVYYPIISQKHAVKYADLFPVFASKPEGALSGQEISLNYPLGTMKYNRDAAVLLESWRYDMMNEMISPNIFSFSQRSSLFLDHFCSGNSTVAGVFGMFYGIHPTYWTAVKANSVSIDNPVLIDVMKENRYEFGIFAKSNFQRHKIKDTVFRGIEVHEDFAGETFMEQDRDMTEQVLSFIRLRKDDPDPFMALAFYKSDHFPYFYPEEDSLFLPAAELNFMLTSADTDPADYLNDCRNSTHFVDKLVGSIIDELDGLGIMNNTVVIITTDHADEFNDNRANYWGHGTNFTQYQIKVPLILHLPGRDPRQVEYITSHIDIPPTLLQEVFGCMSDIGDYSNGRNLFDEHMGSRPLVIGGYVNHAFIIEDNVFEIYPMLTKKYKLQDINLKASDPPSDILMIIKEETNRFYIDIGRDSGVDRSAIGSPIRYDEIQTR